MMKNTIINNINMLLLFMFLSLSPYATYCIFPVYAASSQHKEDVKTISVDFYKIDLHNVFRLLSKVSGKNIVVDEDVSGAITLSLKDVPWELVLDIIKNLKNLESIEKHNTIMIFPASKAVQWQKDSSEGELQVSKLIVKKEFSVKSSLDSIKKAQEFLNDGQYELKEGNFEKALELYKNALKLWPDNINIAKKIASLAIGRLNEALTAFNYAKIALQIDPSDTEAASLAAVALTRLGRKKEAEAFFERSIISSATPSFDALYNYSVFLFSQNRFREALRNLNRIEDEFMLTPDCIILKARCFEALRLTDKAIREYAAILNSGNDIKPEIIDYAKERLKILKK